MLNVTVGNLQLQTPLLLASGFITETPEFFFKAKLYGCAGMITRSLKEHVPPERVHVPAPRYVVFQESMLNCEWGNENPWTDWLNKDVGRVKSTGSPIIISMSGREPEGCANMIRAFDKLGVDAYEINISCSHSGVLHGNLNVDFLHLQKVMHTLREITKTPIWVKLSYSSQLLEMAAEAERLGADVIVCTNSIGPGMLIDTYSGKAKLGVKGGGGGMTGRAIFPIALWCVHQLSKNVRIPVIGCGGISTADHVLQMLMAGASAVQVYSAAALKGPAVFKRINDGIGKFLEKNKRYASLQDMIGVVSRLTSENHFSSPRPVVIAEKCTGCGVCVHACAFDALDLVSLPDKSVLAVIKDNCISCNACVGVCPPKFDAIEAFY